MVDNICIILLFFQLCSALKILTTPKFPDGQTPPSSFATVKNAKLFTGENISICFWVSLPHEHYAEVLSQTEGSGLLVTFRADGNYFAVNSYFVRFEYASDEPFVPSSWIFFCFTFHNAEKIIRIYQWLCNCACPAQPVRTGLGPKLVGRLWTYLVTPSCPRSYLGTTGGPDMTRSRWSYTPCVCGRDYL